MFVVLEWNQASGQPRVAVDDVFYDEQEAVALAADLTREAARVGRRERYTVHELDELDEGGQ